MSERRCPVCGVAPGQEHIASMHEAGRAAARLEDAVATVHLMHGIQVRAGSYPEFLLTFPVLSFEVIKGGVLRCEPADKTLGDRLFLSPSTWGRVVER